MEIRRINEFLISFYIGRPPSLKGIAPSGPLDWPTRGAINLGLSSYAIVRGEKALVYDTMISLKHARQVKGYLRGLGVEHFMVVLSHWHLDHIAGVSAYKRSPIIAHRQTREMLSQNREAIEMGTFWGPPGFPIVLPNITFQDKVEIHLDDIMVELHNFNIHSPDAVLLYLPDARTVLSGDTLEDMLTYVKTPQDIPTNIAELKRLSTWEIDRIYPNHGAPQVLWKGGYDVTLIQATIDYITRLVQRAHDVDYLASRMEGYTADAVRDGWIHHWEPYRVVHRQNLEQVHAYYRDKPLPSL